MLSAREKVLIDTHVHLDLLPEEGKAEAELDHARRGGVGKFVVPGVRRHGWAGLFRLAARREEVLPAPGLHPLAAGEWDEESAAELESYLRGGKAVAVGEIGLDRLFSSPSPEVQERAFRAQLRLAAAFARPVLLHCRNAAGRLLAILDEENFRSGGIWHSFSGSPETARAAVERGFLISFAGPLTYPNARRGPEVLRTLPASAIVLETDAPDLPPHPHRHESNRPCWLLLVAARVSEIRGWSAAETARITTENARRVLNIDR